MRSMGHPLFVYTPRSRAAVAKQRASMMRRLGIPEGHVRIYGEHVPDEHAEPMRYWAYWIAWKMGRKHAERFVSEQVRSAYSGIDFIRQQYAEKLKVRGNREAIRELREACHAN